MERIQPDAVGALLAEQRYPGRGLVAGRLRSGEPVLAYFVTGRSDASLSRAAVVEANGDVRIVATDGSGDDPLRHYLALARRGSWWIVGNGHHVSPIADRLERDGDVLGALSDWDYEPDDPICTPRSSARCEAMARASAASPSAQPDPR